MAKMHELIAVEDDIKGQANKTSGELISTFNNKKHLFSQKIVTFQGLEETSKAVTESQSSIQTTLVKELNWITDFLSKGIDIGYQVDKGNTVATADLIVEVDDKIVLRIDKVPTTALLRLEKKIIDVRDLAKAIPTLDPAQGFEPDPAMEPGTYKAKEVKKMRTKKVLKTVSLAAATKEHKEQVVRESEDVDVGTIKEQEWSSMTTPHLKAQILNRCDILIQAVKKARSRANAHELDVAGLKIGRTLLDYVFAPVTATAAK